jgi:hypothetical protein
MEAHQPDPTTRVEPDPWETVYDQVGEIGDRLKVIYQGVAGERGPSEEEIRQALVTLTGVWDQLSSSFSVVFQDPELRQRLRTTAAALGEALGDTIAGVGRDLRHDGEEE